MESTKKPSPSGASLAQPAGKIGTVAVVLATENQRDSKHLESDMRTEHWVETFSDEREIHQLELAIEAAEPYPLQCVYKWRERAEKEDTEFGDYVEDLLTQPSTRAEVQAHGVAWLKSKLKIDQFRQQEKEAAEVIANYALTQYEKNPEMTDFVLAGPGVQVRIRIFKIRLQAGQQISAA